MQATYPGILAVFARFCYRKNKTFSTRVLRVFFLYSAAKYKKRGAEKCK